MSVSARCIAIGVMVFSYWVAAFVVALMNTFGAFWEIDSGGWWNIVWLREPGNLLGSEVFKLLEMVPGWNYANLVGWPLYIALFVTAASMGAGAWLIAAQSSTWWRRRKRPFPPTAS